MSDDSSDGHFYLTDLSERDKPWDEHRASAMIVESLYESTEFARYSDRIRQCSLRLIFALSATEEGDLKLRLHAAKFCRVRHCPVCQWRRSLMWRARFFEAIPSLLTDHPKARFIFLTLTVKNCPVDELRAVLSHMGQSWQRLSQRAVFPAVGWVRSVEVTRNPLDRTAHPHYHAILMVKSTYFKGTHYLSQDEWRQLWKEALRVDYLPVVNVRAVRARASKAPVDPETGAVEQGQDLAAGILETLKYGVKVQDLVSDPDWLVEITRQMHKTRAVAVGGLLKQYLNDSEPEELIAEGATDLDLSEAPKLVFDWLEWIKRYTKSIST